MGTYIISRYVQFRKFLFLTHPVRGHGVIKYPQIKLKSNKICQQDSIILMIFCNIRANSSTYYCLCKCHILDICKLLTPRKA